MDMLTQPQLTIIVPIYNVEEWIREALESLTNQTFRNFEVILIDDGSTDESATIAKAFCQRDERFQYFLQDNIGLGGARNAGLKLVNSEYFSFFDSDDVLDERYCEKMLDAAVSNGADVVSCSFKRFKSNVSEPTSERPLKSTEAELGGYELNQGELILGLHSSSMSCARLYRTSLVRDEGIVFPESLPHEDWFFTYKILLLSEKTVFIPDELYNWRIREGSLSRTTRKEHVLAYFAMISDTNEFIEKIGQSATLTQAAIRRNLILLDQMHRRSQRGSEDCQKLFLELASERLGLFTSMLEAAHPRFVGESVTSTAEKTIELVAAHSSWQILKKKPRMDSLLSMATGRESRARDLRWLRDAFAGERCFIIGNGPSLNKHDLSKIKDEYSFGVNSIFLKTRTSGFMPAFYVVEDSKVMEENSEAIRQYPAPFRFFPREYSEYGIDGKTTFFFDLDQDFYRKSSRHHGIPRFSIDAADTIFAGQTVTYVNLQIAFYLGFSDVYLIGMDFDYVIPSEHVRVGNHIISTTDDPNHFHKDYFGVGKTWKDPKLDRVLFSYKMAKVVYEAAGRRIFNATKGGKLEVFPRIDYDSLFTEIKPDGPTHLVSAEGSRQGAEAYAIVSSHSTSEPFAAYKSVYPQSSSPTRSPGDHVGRACADSDGAWRLRVLQLTAKLLGGGGTNEADALRSAIAGHDPDDPASRHATKVLDFVDRKEKAATR